jgi:hypothetical protein
MDTQRTKLTIPRDPTTGELDSPRFNAVWGVIKDWDIRRDSDGLYGGATGTDVCMILDALDKTRGSLFCDEHRHTSAPPAPLKRNLFNELAEGIDAMKESRVKLAPPAPDANTMLTWNSHLVEWDRRVEPESRIYPEIKAEPTTPTPAAHSVHKNVEGGNDYMHYRDCGAQWDYRRGPAPATCVPTASDLCSACGFPKSDGYVHPVLPSAQRCDHRRQATPAPAAPQGAEPQVSELLGKYLNTMISDLRINNKGQYMRELFSKYETELNAASRVQVLEERLARTEEGEKLLQKLVQMAKQEWLLTEFDPVIVKVAKWLKEPALTEDSNGG